MGPLLEKLGYNTVDMTKNNSVSTMDSKAAFLVSSFREPLSHFLSAFEWVHQHHRGTLNKQDPLKDYINKNIENAKTKHSVSNSWHFQMADIQSKSFLSYNGDNTTHNYLTFKRANAKESVANMKKLFWFAIESEMQVSLALLHCQVFGEIKDHLLPKPLVSTFSQGTKTVTQFNFINSKEEMKQVSDLTFVDQRFFEHACAEFWRRVELHATCMGRVMDSYEPSPVYRYRKRNRRLRA